MWPRRPPCSPHWRTARRSPATWSASSKSAGGWRSGWPASPGCACTPRRRTSCSARCRAGRRRRCNRSCGSAACLSATSTRRACAAACGSASAGRRTRTAWWRRWRRSERALPESARTASVRRETRETIVSVELSLDGSGRYRVSTGIGMLDHMLEQLAKHGLLDLTVDATGDIDRDPHHLVEDVGLVLGQALDRALGERRGITRFGHAVVPVALDLGGRAHAGIEFNFERELLGQLPTENIGHFLAAFANEGRLNLHVLELAGENDHHRIEAAFKGLALALRQAVSLNPRISGEIPSTKEAL